MSEKGKEDKTELSTIMEAPELMLGLSQDLEDKSQQKKEEPKKQASKAYTTLSVDADLPMIGLEVLKGRGVDKSGYVFVFLSFFSFSLFHLS